MAVKDFMTRKVVYISPGTTIAHAADLYEQGLNCLASHWNDKLVGLADRRPIAEASPSSNKFINFSRWTICWTRPSSRMSCFSRAVSKFASLEDATYLMYKNKVGILQSWRMTKSFGATKRLWRISQLLSWKYRAMEKKEFVFALDRR